MLNNAMKLSTILTISTVSLLLIQGCNKNNTVKDSNGSPIVATTMVSKVKGNTPSPSLIEAFCLNGGYHKASTSQNSNIFELIIPTNIGCHLVITNNQNDVNNTIITPLSIKENNHESSAFKVQGDVLNLGEINLITKLKQITDINGDHVTDTPFQVIITSGDIEVISSNQDIMDTDDDGIINLFEDDDSDGIPNYTDNDDDNDGLLDTQDSDYKNDTDGDGIIDSRDIDIDNDGNPNRLDTDNSNGNDLPQ